MFTTSWCIPWGFKHLRGRYSWWVYEKSKNFCNQNALYRIRSYTKSWLILLAKNFYMFYIKLNWNEMKTNNISHNHDLCVEWVCQFLFETNKIWIHRVKTKPLYFFLHFSYCEKEITHEKKRKSNGGENEIKKKQMFGRVMVFI